MSIFNKISDQITARLIAEPFLDGFRIITFRDREIESEFQKFEGNARGVGIAMVGWAGCKNDNRDGSGPVVKNSFVVTVTFKPILRRGMKDPDDIVSEIIRSIHGWTPKGVMDCYDDLEFEAADPVPHPQYLIYRISFSGTAKIKPIKSTTP